MKYTSKIVAILVLLSICFLVNTAASEESKKGRITSKINPEFIKYLEKKKSDGIPQTWDGHGLGLAPNFFDWNQFDSTNLKKRIKTDFPDSYDLRDHNKVTPVRNQLTCGACWAFAAIGSLESSLRPEEDWDFSENHVNNKHGFDFPFCEGGTKDMTTAYFTRMQGPVLEKDDPYDPDTPTSPQVDPEVQKHVTDAIYLPGKRGSGESFAYDNDVLKWAIMNYGGIQTSIFMGVNTSTFYRDDFASFYNPGDHEDSYGGSHAVLIVGWDDFYPATQFRINAPGDGAYIVKNSWGTEWGDNGYFYVSYFDIRVGRELTVYQSIENNDMTMYMYDPLGVTDVYGEYYHGWGANIFTSEKSLPIASVGLFTLDENTEYEIYVYDEVGSTPTDGTLINTTTGTIEFAGYHTIPLSETGLIINQGHKFSIVVNYYTPGEYSPVPIEARHNGFTSEAYANSGESFISEDGVTWYDVTNSESSANVCIRALFVGCLQDSDCADDGLSCTESVCDGHLGCQHVVKDDYCLINKTCRNKYDENPDSTCQQCDPDLSQTQWSDKQEGSTCNDGNNCTKDDSCKSGTCSGTTYNCDDGLECTSNVCDGKGGCSYSTKSNYCLINNTCYNSGNSKPSNNCYYCDPNKSTSVWTESASTTTCNDQNICTKNDHCEAGLCVGGEDVICDDGNECTAGTCDTDNGCSHTNVEDGTVCNEEEGVFNCYDGECVQTGCSGSCSSDLTSCIDEETVCKCKDESWTELDCVAFCKDMGRESNGCGQVGLGDTYGCSCGSKLDSADTDGDAEIIEDGDIESTDENQGSSGSGSSGCNNTQNSSTIILLLALVGLVARKRIFG